MAERDFEKGGLEHIREESPIDSRSPEEQERRRKKRETQDTLHSVDLANALAFKGDDSDGKVAWTFRKLLAAGFLSMLYTAGQLPVYFVGGTLTFIAEDLGSQNISGWLPVANTLAVAAVCPFVGYLQDMFGKRWIILISTTFLCAGCAILATAHGLVQALVGMVIAGAAAGAGELTGLAGLSEVVPVKHRGLSMAVLTAFVLPFTPYILYGQLYSTTGPMPSWRYGPYICLVYSGITLIGLALTYFPHGHRRADGMSRADVLKRIDYIGGFLSIAGIVLFLVALQSGGYTHPWTSAYTLCTLFIGLALLAAWVIWEWKFAPYPMIPKALFQGQRVVGFAFGVAFVAGFNFYSLLNFWPLTIANVWDPDPIAIGWRGFPVILFVAVGASCWNVLLSVWKGRANLVLLLSATMLTAFGGSLASMTPDSETRSVVLASFAAFGLGGGIVPAATVAMIAAPDELITTCAALSLSVRSVGGSIGYSVYYSIFTNKLAERLPVLVAEYAVRAGLPMSSAEAFVGTYVTAPANVTMIEGVTEQVVDAALMGSQWAYAEALHLVWYASIPFGVCMMACALAIPDTRKFLTNRVAVEL